MQPKAKRAILYARVSTPQQAKLYSLDFQIEQERQYLESIGAVAVAEIKDDQTGRKLDRDGLDQARELLASDQADILVTWKIDRLHRNYVNSVYLRDELRRLGKELHYAQSGTKSGATAKERLPEDIQYIFSEIEADEIIERTKNGRLRKAAVGQKWIGLNRPPFGYATLGHRKDIELIIDPETSEIVRQIYTLYVLGDSGRSLSTLDIAKRLTAMGIPTPQDRIGTRANLKKRGYAEWSRNTVHKILRHEAYSGVFYQFKYTGRSGSIRLNPNRDEWISVPVPQIVDKELWDAAQIKMDKGRELSKRNQTQVNQYLVSRHIYCQCGYKMRASTSLSQQQAERLKDGKPWSYYRCPGKKAGGNAVRCTLKTQNARVLDARVWDWVKQELANPVLVERKLRELQANESEDSTKRDQDLQALYQNKYTIEQEMLRLGQLYARQALPDNILDQLMSAERQKLQLTQAEIDRVTALASTPITDDRILTVVQFAEDLAARLGTLEQGFENRRRVIEAINLRVTVRLIEGEYWLELGSDLNAVTELRTLLPNR